MDVRTIALWLVAACTGSLVQAQMSQDTAALINACSAIPDDAKRSQCFEAVARAGRPSELTPSHASAGDGLVRSFAAIKAAVETGVTYANYSQLLGPAATEVELLRQRAKSEAEQVAVQQLARALEAYGDAATFWQADIRFYSRRGNDQAYSGGLPVKQVGLEHLVSKWSMPTAKSDVWGINVGVPRASGLRHLWSIAGDSAQAGLAQLKPAQ